MDKNIYILYDPLIEDKESLQKFNKILVLAGFKEEQLVTLSQDKYLEYLSNEQNPFYNFVIAINQTYKTINQIYSQRLDIPIFEFFSKEFVSNSKDLVLFGLLFSVKAIYEPAYKKFSWGVVQKFYTEVNNKLNNVESDEPECDYFDNPADKVLEKVVEKVVLEEVKVEPVIEEKITTTIVENVLHKDADEINKKLLDFFNKTSGFFKMYSEIQNDIEILKKDLNIEKL